MTPVNAIGGARCKTRLMIAQLPPDRMPPPRPEGIPRFQRLFREAAGLNFDKADLKRYQDFIDHRIYLLLLRALRAPSLAPQLDHLNAEPLLHPKRADS